MEEVANRKILFFSYSTVAAAILVSVLQGLYFVLDGRWSFYNAAAVGLAAATIFFGLRFLFSKSTEFLARIILLYAAQLAFIIVKFLDVEPSSAPRLLTVAVVLLHGAIVASVLLSRFRIVVWPKFFLACFLLSFVVFLGEIYLRSTKFFQPVQRAGSHRQWGDAVAPHPTLETVYKPGSTHKQYYSQNPHGSFRQGDPMKSEWWFRTGGTALAEMVSTNEPGVVRLQIQKAESKAAYDIQLNLTKIPVEGGAKHRVKFSGRADKPRSMSVGFAMSHEPWTGLGLYNKVELKPEWQLFQMDFTSTASDNNARIHFDAGESDVPVEIKEVQLISLSDGKAVESQMKYFVEYRFNSLGCRGPDYEIPKPAGKRRILVLGDSYALGAGVNEEDTLSSKIQAAIPSYEVINCGVSGYGVQQARLFYKYYANQYQPDLVLLVLTTNANHEVLEELNPKGPLFNTWAKFWRHFYPFDYSVAADEITQLDRRLRNDRSRLALILFRINEDHKGKSKKGKQWNALQRDVTKDLRDANIPLLDLDQPLHAKHKETDLVVLPKSDTHPNKIAQEIAARETLNFLQKEKLINP